MPVTVRAVISARKGPDNTDEIPKKTRHVALRFELVDHTQSCFLPPALPQAVALLLRPPLLLWLRLLL